VPISDYLKGLRQYVGHNLLLCPGAAAIIRDEAGRVLLQRRSDNGQWGVVGGGTDPGEMPAQALVREAYEETGLIVKPERCLGVIRFAGIYPNGDQLEMTVSVFDCRIAGGKLESLDGESLELRFFDPAVLPDSAGLKRYPSFMFKGEPQAAYFEWDERWLETLRLGQASAFHSELRSAIGQELSLLVGSTALIEDDAGHILLLRRRDNGLWDLPGGSTQPGETPAQTLIRETLEETGLTVRPEKLLATYGGLPFRFAAQQSELHGHLFKCKVLGGDLKPLDGEALELRFFAADALPAASELHSVLLKRYKLHPLLSASPFFEWQPNWLKLEP
jgi:8-oxo-dGTP diphosphatase